MAEISIKASLTGAQEAQAGIAALSAATKELNTSNEQWANIQANLQRLAQEHQTSLQARAASTQRLKDHTNELVRKFNEQEDAEHRAAGAGNQLTQSIAGMAARFAATTFSIAAFGATIITAFNAGREAELSLVKLDASLTATGNSVGKTTQQLQEMAEALAKGTRFDATGIQEAMQVLLTFDNVQGDIFEGAIRHAQNLSEKFGMDLSSAARLLGRALQEPGEGIQALSRYIGTLNPAVVENIQKLNEQGRTAEAQAELIKLLDGRMKGFAETVGQSAPASFDKMKIAWHNLLEEMGKTRGAEGFFAFVEERLDNVTGFFKNWTLIMRGIAIDRDLRFLNDASTTAEERVIIEKRLNDSLTQLNKDADEERQRQRDAELAAKVKEWDEEEKKKKEFAAKQIQENEELLKKIEADEEQAVRKRIELMDMEIKAKTMTLDSKLQLLEEELSFVQQGTAAWVTLTKERLSVLEEIDKREETNIRRVIERYDVDIKMGRATFAQKIQFIDAQLAKEEDGSAKWIELMKARQQTEDEMARRAKQRSAEEEQALKKRQRSFAEQADDEIAVIRKTFFATEDLRLEALEKLARGYKHLGEDGEEAYDRIVKAMKNVETTAERQTKRMQAVLGEAGFDMINIVGSVNTAWARTFVDMFNGAATFSETIKKLWHNLVDAIIEEIARMVARWLAAQAIMGFFSIASGIGGLGGFFGGSPAAPGLSAAKWVATGGDMIATSPTDFIVGEGGVANIRGFQDGGEGVFTRPTLFRAGEGGPERVRVTPLAGGPNTKEDNNDKPASALASVWDSIRNALRPMVEALDEVGDKQGELLKSTITFAEAFKNQWRGVSRALVTEQSEMSEATAAFIQTLKGYWSRTMALQPLWNITARNAEWFFQGAPDRSQSDAVAGRFSGAHLVRGFQHGGEGVFTQPTLFRAGEVGPERVRVEPLAGGAGSGGSSGVTVIFQGTNIIDAFSRRRFIREQERLISAEARRRG